MSRCMEKLKEYLKGQSKGLFAESIGISPTHLSRILGGITPSYDLMVKIHRETGGAVTPNDWLKVETKEKTS